ncbi:nuclear transport factor 2 family protein [Thermodesulfobacteriota bacterium]
MSEEELEARIKTLENQIRAQENQLRTLQDIEEIKILQRAYGYYIEHWMSQEIIDLFSDGPDVALTLGAGTYLGKEGVIKYFEHMDGTNPEFFHQVMQLSGIVHIDPDGKRAKGRWYGWGAVAIPKEKGVKQSFFSGIYVGEYVKEDGKWKIEKLRFDQKYNATPAEGWVKPERVIKIDQQRDLPVLEPDIPRTFSPRYPSGYIFPFHYKHPVTGKETTEGARNSSIEGVIT